METLKFEYPAKTQLFRRAHVGVVGSGDLEVLLEPSRQPIAYVEVRTGCPGFEDTWAAVLGRFFFENDVAADIPVNDFGATPGVVALRLAQALEVSRYDSCNER